MGNYSIISSETESDIETRESRSIKFVNKIAGQIDNDDERSDGIWNKIIGSESFVINNIRIKNEGGRWKKISINSVVDNTNINNNRNNNNNNNNNKNKRLVNRRCKINYTNNNYRYNLLRRFLIFLVVSSITMQLMRSVESSPTPSLKNEMKIRMNNDDKNGENDYDNYNNEYHSIDDDVTNELMTMNDDKNRIIDNENDRSIEDDDLGDEDDEETEISRFSDDHSQRQSQIFDYNDDNDNNDDDDEDSFPDRNSHDSPRSDSLDSEELDKIRKSIMEDLGLARIPDPSKANVSQTEYEKAHREYLKRTELSSGQDRRTRRKLHVFYPEDRILVNGSSTRNRMLIKTMKIGEYYEPNSLYFPVKIPLENHAIDHAELRILIGVNEDMNYAREDDADGSLKDVEVSIYQPTRSSARRLISQRRVSVSRSAPRWAEFDSTEAVASWLYEGEENLGLEVEISSVTGQRWSASRGTPAALNVFTISDSRPESNRMRRATPDQLLSLHRGRRTECRGQNKKCCRHQMTVVFKDLKGFEFIIQPKNFDAGYCKGRCPPRYNPAHHHALLQSLIWKEDRKKAPRPCCAPSKLSELEILYFDEDDATKLKVSNWKNMKVVECACS